MKARFELTNIEEVEGTLSITLRMGEWRRLLEQITGTNHPAWKLRAAIQAMLQDAQKHFATAGEEREF